MSDTWLQTQKSRSRARYDIILNLLALHGEMDPNDIAEVLGLSLNATNAYLFNLRSEKKIHVSGKVFGNKGYLWSLGAAPDPNAQPRKAGTRTKSLIGVPGGQRSKEGTPVIIRKKATPPSVPRINWWDVCGVLEAA